MAMTLPIPIPSTPSAGNSPASDDSNPPHTPVSPNTQSLPPPDQSTNSQPASIANSTQSQPPKRKPSRRANTAERRATHNAVERQRRETLNGRFLDLAALLPNLSQIRRPSKSSIVNSSIAHIHASRRHRLLAARELRLVKAESDALRRELNEWRDRAGLPRVEEPVRGEGFTMVLSGELEVLAAVPGGEEEEEDPGFGGFEDGDDEYTNGLPSAHPRMEDIDERHASIAMIKNANAFAHNLPSSNGALAHILPRSSQGPMIASSPTAVSFENPAMGAMYEPHYGSQHFMQQQHSDVDKVAAWNAAQLYMGQNQQQQNLIQNQRSLFTPPATSHGLPANQQNSTPFNDQALFAFQRQQQQMAAIQQNSQLGGHIFGSPERDDVSSTGSVDQGRARSGSLGAGSGYGSPGHVSSPVGSYEMPSALSSGEYAIPRRMASGGAGLHVNTAAANGGAPGSWGRETDLGGMGLMKQGLNTPPISVGGGGNGAGFAMMM